MAQTLPGPVHKSGGRETIQFGKRFLARRRKRQPGRARSPAKSQLVAVRLGGRLQRPGQWQFGVDERGKRLKFSRLQIFICANLTFYDRQRFSYIHRLASLAQTEKSSCDSVFSIGAHLPTDTKVPQDDWCRDSRCSKAFCIGIGT